MQFRISLRVQLASITLILAAIPYLGYNYIWEMESYLRKGQENTMVGTARAVATMLHERPSLLDVNAAYRNQLRPGTDLYAPTLPGPIRLDGRFNDWKTVENVLFTYGNADVVVATENGTKVHTDQPHLVKLTHMVGRYGAYLYARFTVYDNNVVWRAKNSLRVENNDHLLIGLKDSFDQLQRYVVSPYAPGWVNAYQLDGDEGYDITGNATFIQGEWILTDKGVNIELRLPLELTKRGLAFAYMDATSNASFHAIGIGTANPNNVRELGSVVTPSPEIERVLRSMQYSDSRVWVVDRYQRVLAKVGDIQSSRGFSSPNSDSEDNLWKAFELKYLLPLYYQILTRPPASFLDSLTNAMALEGEDIQSALSGKPDTQWRLSEDNKAVILSASHPIYFEENVIGAVIVEQTTHGIRTLRNQALEDLFNIILAVMLIAVMGLVFMSHRTSHRIRSLRDATEKVIDDNGKIVGQLTTPRVYDEIGDLWSTFNDVFSRLNQYNTYLESMSSRLSHELRTPVAVVKSSLDMLPSIADEDQRSTVIKRAQQGIERLSKMLNSMSEATRLEQTLQCEEKRRFDVVSVVSSCIQGYESVFSHRYFSFNSVDSAELIGSPDLFVQMLDKVIANASEFSQNDDTIQISIAKTANSLELTVKNPGPMLPEIQQNQLLQSMVSIREQSTQNQQEAHLGLGLYIAHIIARYHNGELCLSNQTDGSGVCVMFKFEL